MNMQDPKSGPLIKLDKNTNFSQRAANAALKTRTQKVVLTKNLKSKDPNILSWLYFGTVDTPDHGSNTGINRRNNTGMQMNDKDFDTHLKLLIQLYDCVNLFLLDNGYKINSNKIIEGGVSISHVIFFYDKY